VVADKTEIAEPVAETQHTFDAFLRTLAEDRGEQAIGIILSGTGTDGTLGLRAILGAGGMSLVQEPATAKYDGKPEDMEHDFPLIGYSKLLFNARRIAGNSRPLIMPEIEEAA
jgi:hypothetical protein